MKQMNSKTLFVVVAAFVLVLVISSCSSLPLLQDKTPTQVAEPSIVPPTTTETTSTESDFVPDVEINLTATQQQVQILPGQSTTVWTYQGTLVRGETSNLQPLKDSYLGPVISIKKGQKVRVHFKNELPEPSIIHWHGLLVESRMDGHPRDAIQPGETYVYEFEVVNRAGTYWFHPHPEPLTGSQVIKGLAGLFIVSDEEEAALNLPSDGYDIPLVIQDRTFDANNQITSVQGHAMPGMASMDMMMGFLGERIFVNGQETPLLPVATRAYRLRLLNGSNSRVYKLGWSNGAPLTVIATDGGLLERPVERPYVMLGPGERIELWADFTQLPLGSEVTLQSLPFLGAEGDSLLESESSMPGMDHGNMPGMGETSSGGGEMAGYNPKVPNGAGFPVLHVRVERQEQETLSLPSKLSKISRYSLDQAVNASQPRRIGLSMSNMSWLLNGRFFKLEEVAPDEVAKLGTLEVWEFVNEENPNESMEKMGMVHPMHIHGVQFQAIDRQMSVRELQAGWDSVSEGYVDEGWKDTVLVMPGETVKVLVRYDFTDLFLFHCHNLEHEDLGMMRNYQVIPEE